MEALHQLVMQPAVRLVRPVQVDNAEEAVVVAVEDPDRDEAVLDRAAGSPGQAPDSVIGPMGPAIAGDPGQGTVQQRLAPRCLAGHRHTGVRQGDGSPQREVEQQRPGKPQLEVGLIDQRSTCGRVVGQQIEVLSR